MFDSVGAAAAQRCPQDTRALLGGGSHISVQWE